MFRDLLVHVDGSEAGRRRVRFAVDLAARMGARLSGHVTPAPEVPPLYKPSMVTKVAADIASDLASDAREAAKIFSEETRQRLADSRWLEAAGDVVRRICAKARYADLVILGQYERQGSSEAHPLPVAHPVVLRRGRPVLIAPADVRPSALARIAVAWDGSSEAVRAVHDACCAWRSRSRSWRSATPLPKIPRSTARACQPISQITESGLARMSCKADRPRSTHRSEGRSRRGTTIWW